ncbi:MAG: N-acetylmuramic acid 6-phosphate etherase, partial [Kineothrix sp.]|nr:N-acetylmuramic acid 6-phosphate etherase [Kineothrix sp.]
VVCNKDSEIGRICPLTIEAEPGPEVLTGSTRLKAGTTTKLILNMISTISMIRIGKIYKNYMVDVKMSNEKLVTRGTNIVSAVTGCSHEEAKEALAKSGGGVRTAIAMLLLGCGKEEAESALQAVNGRIQSLEKEGQK